MDWVYSWMDITLSKTLLFILVFCVLLLGKHGEFFYSA